jgi:hypothetical protein
MSDAAARRALAEAALKIAAGAPWTGVTLHNLAAAAGRAPVDFYPLTAADAFDCVDEYFDRAAGAQAPAPDPASLLRDRVFDIAMRRFEAMEPHRAALGALDKGIEGEPLAQAAAFARQTRTARWLLALAGADGEGVGAAARTQALALVLRRTRAAWTRDDAGDFAKTMAALDKGLRRADEFFEQVGRMTAGLMPSAGKPKREDEAPREAPPSANSPE